VQSFFGIVQLDHEDNFSSEEEEELDGFGSNKLRDFVDSRRSVFFESDELQSGEEDSAEEEEEDGGDEQEKQGAESSHGTVQRQVTGETALLNAGALPLLRQLRAEISEALAELGAGKWAAGLAKSANACRLMVPCARQELEPYVEAV